jgi:hypothetical protein
LLGRGRKQLTGRTPFRLQRKVTLNFTLKPKGPRGGRVLDFEQIALLAHDQPAAIVLDLVNPLRTDKFVQPASCFRGGTCN